MNARNQFRRKYLEPWDPREARRQSLGIRVAFDSETIVSPRLSYNIIKSFIQDEDLPTSSLGACMHIANHREGDTPRSLIN